MKKSILVGLCCLVLPASATEPNSVTIGLDEFLRVYEASKNRPENPENPGLEFTLSSVAYEGEVVNGADGAPASVVFTAKIHVDRHEAKGWSNVPLLSGEAALIEATMDGKPAPLVLWGDRYTLVTNRTGGFDLKLKFAVTLSNDQGLSAFSFPMERCGSNNLTLTIPTDDALEVTVAGARISDDKLAAGKQVINASLPSGDRLSVRWQRKVRSADPEQEVARVYAEVHSLVDVADGLLRATTTVQHTILFAGVDTFRYDLPDDMTVLDVRGSGLREWTVTADGTLVVNLGYAAEAAATLTFDLERAIGEGSRTVDAPLVVPLGVERSKGWVGVTSGGNLEVDAGDVKSASPVDVRTLPATIVGRTNQPVLLGYKYLGTDAKVPLVIKQHDEVDVLVTLVDQVAATTMFTEDGRRLSSVVYEVRNNRRQYLRVQLPAGAELWSSAVAGRAVQPAKAGDGAILMPLIRSASSGAGLSSFSVEVVYVESMAAPSASGKGMFEADLPRVDAPSTYVQWTVYAPSRAKVPKNSFEGSLRSVVYPTRPLGAVDTLVVQQAVEETVSAAQNTASAGGLGNGAAPVRVELPLEGQAFYFEKLLVLDERLWVGFDFGGLK